MPAGTAKGTNPSDGVAGEVNLGQVLSPTAFADLMATANACYLTLTGAAGGKSFKGIAIDGTGGQAATPAARTIAFSGGASTISVTGGNLNVTLDVGQGTVFNRFVDVTGNLVQQGGAVTLTANGASSFTTSAGNPLTITSNASADWTSSGTLRVDGVTLNLGTTAATNVNVGRSGQSIGFYGATAAAQQASGANLTNNVSSGGVNDTIANFTDLTTYANDAGTIRNDIYQLARKLKQVNDALRLYGLLT